MIILPEGTVHEWTHARSGSEWALLSNTLAGHSLTALMRGDDAMCDDWCMLSNLAWQHSLDAYDADWMDQAEHISAEAA
jgi:hypothetical protein